jgi:hypothetical protein
MNIYLICKHRKFKDDKGFNVFKECLIFDAYQSKALATFIVKDLNSKSKKYWYSIKKLEVYL